jgi:general secretion pathway protein D
MTSLRRSLAIITFLLFCGLVTAESPHSLLNKGIKAEARQDYEAAYEYYKAAYEKRLDDLKYQVPLERTRFLAAASKVKRGQTLREQGKLNDALELFAKAVEVDPSNELARQEIRHTQEMLKRQTVAEGQTHSPTPPPPPEAEPTRKWLEDADGPVRLCAISNVPLQAIKITGDSKTIYETVGRIAGINILFDPEYTSRNISIDLRGVTLQQALRVLALQSRTFWRPVTPNTIFVAADNQGKRRELEQSVVQTFYIGHVSTPTDLQDVVTSIRNILEVQRIQPLPSQNAIVVRGTPSQLALAQKLIDDIDQSKPEVVIDIVVAQVRHDKVRQMGILSPQVGSVALQGSNPTTTGNSPGLNLNNLQHLTSTNYAVSLSAVQAQLLFNDSNTTIVERPQLRAADGIKASLKIGDRIPIATGSFGAPLGIGNGGGQLGVNTQFQYLDVGVKIDITPRIQADNEISLKIGLELSNKTGDQPIGGITQPIISQRTVDHEIQLKDGEMHLLGGILEEQVTLNTNGIPILSRLPLLRYIFGQEDKQRHTNEVVFLIVPHIVRGRILSPLNRKAFDVGTGIGIDLLTAEKPATKLENSDVQQCVAPASAASSDPVRAQPQTPAIQTQPTLPAPTQPQPPPEDLRSAMKSFRRPTYRIGS